MSNSFGDFHFFMMANMINKGNEPFNYEVIYLNPIFVETTLNCTYNLSRNVKNKIN